MKTTGSRNSRRKTLWVDPKILGQILIYFNGLSAIVLALLFLAQISFLSHISDARLIQDAKLLFGIIGIFTLLLTNLVGLLMAHRLAGPMMQLKRYLEEIAQNPQRHQKPLEFRPTDFFQDLPPLINRVLETKSNGQNQKHQT